MTLKDFILKHIAKIKDGTFNKVECGDEMVELGFEEHIMPICWHLTNYYVTNNIPYKKEPARQEGEI